MYTGAVQAGRCVGPENRTAPENTNRKRNNHEKLDGNRDSRANAFGYY